MVSSPAALNLSGPSGTVLPGSVVELSGSLQLDGLPMPGSTLTLSSAGSGGTLATSTVTVDDTGSFSATFTPPPTGTGSATVTASVEVEGQQVTRDVAVSWTGTVPGDRLVFHGTNVDGQLTLKVSKVEPLATTELFSAAVPNSGQPPFVQSPWMYLRQQQRIVITVLVGSLRGWAYLDTGGSVELAYSPPPFTDEILTAVGSNGKYRAHWHGYKYCDLSLPEVSACTVTKAVVVYDNATGAVVDQLDPRPYGPFGLASAWAVGPAGELLLPEFGGNGSPVSTTWYLHKIGGATTAIGSFPGSGAAFSASGDKAYFGDPSSLVEVVLATGASRTLAPFGTSRVAATYWAIEDGGLLYVDTADPEPRQLHRLDLASGQVTDVGALPVAPMDDLPRLSSWVYMVP